LLPNSRNALKQARAKVIFLVSFLIDTINGFYDNEIIPLVPPLEYKTCELGIFAASLEFGELSPQNPSTLQR